MVLGSYVCSLFGRGRWLECTDKQQLSESGAAIYMRYTCVEGYSLLLHPFVVSLVVGPLLFYHNYTHVHAALILLDSLLR